MAAMEDTIESLKAQLQEKEALLATYRDIVLETAEERQKREEEEWIDRNYLVLLDDEKPEHKKFFMEWIVDNNASRAYSVAYPEAVYNTVKTNACRLLSSLLEKRNFQDFYAKSMEAAQKRTNVSKDDLIKMSKTIYGMALKPKKESWKPQLSAAGKAVELLGKLTGELKDKVVHEGQVINVNLDSTESLLAGGPKSDVQENPETN